MQRVLDAGTDATLEHAAVVRDRHVRFINAVSLIVCGYIIQCAALAAAYGQRQFLPVYGLHFAGIALEPARIHSANPTPPGCGLARNEEGGGVSGSGFKKRTVTQS